MDSAELLIQESHYAPSVHCSYYSVFQLMKCKYVAKLGITSDDYNEQSPSIGSHVFLLNSLSSFISGVRETRDFKRKVVDLKTLRKQSDYDDIHIGTEISSDALRKAKDLVTTIKSI